MNELIAELMAHPYSNGLEGDAERENYVQLITVLAKQVAPLCAVSTDGTNGISTLEEWLFEGEFSGDDTFQSIAAEWDRDMKELMYWDTVAGEEYFLMDIGGNNE